MLKIEEKHLSIVKNILQKYPYDFYAFGSRVNGNPRRLSDLDLCFKAKIPWNERALLESDFEESNLPFTVDIIDYNSIDDAFKTKIKSDLLCIQKIT